MSRPGSRETQQVRVALAGVIACALTFVLPLTGSSALAASELAAVSLIVVALVGALSAAPRYVTLVPGLFTGLPEGDEAAAPILRTRKTDPTHHPLAPRAPGLA